MRLKRQHDTGIWEKPWFRELGPVEKCAFLYILDRCDAAGVWDGDAALAEFQIGQRVDWRTLGKSCNGNLMELENGKVWVVDFCRFQYGDVLKPDSPIHKNVINMLIRHGLATKVLIAGVNGVTPEGLLPVSSQPAPRLLPASRLQRKEEEEEQEESLSLSSGVREDNSEDVGEEIRYDISEKLWYGISDAQVKEWSDAFPGVDVDLQLRQMAGWCDANGAPAKPAAFIFKWLKGEADKTAKKAGGTRR